MKKYFAHRASWVRCLAFVFCLSSLGVLAQAPSPTSIIAPPIKCEKYALKNGLEVILSQDHRLPLVAVDLWYHVGPANERPGRTGFAHLFEHMMFEGSEHVGSKEHDRYLEAAGASDINGTTDFDRTNYFETLPSNQLELALWLESDRMGYLLGKIDQERLVNQRDVVRNERRQSVENSPYGLVEEELFHQLFPKSHPYFAEVIGSHRDIEAARLDDVREFFRQYYSPNNASLAITGDIDPAQAKTWVEKYFSSIPAGPPVPKITAHPPQITAEKRSKVTDQVELPRIYMGWIMPSIFQPGDAESDLLAHILGGGKSSRLYKSLVYEKQIAQDVSVQNQNLLLGSVFELQATAKPGVKIEDLEKAIDQELEKLRSEGPTQAELARARNLIETHMISDLERRGGFGGLADRLNQYNQFLHDPGFLPKDLERYNHATVEDVKRIAADKLKPSARAVVYGLPGNRVVDDPPRATEEPNTKAKGETVAGTMPDEPWRARPPTPQPLGKLTLPVAHSFKLANGLTVLLVEQHQLPIVVAHLLVLNGSDANPVDKPGLASFTSELLPEGTQRRTSSQIADHAAQLGASLRTLTIIDDSIVDIRTLKPNVNPALDLLSDVALHPKFDPPEIERVRKLRETNILQIQDDPQQLAFGVLQKLIYGPGHPYGYRDEGTIKAIHATGRDDLLAMWQRGYAPGNAALVLSGDLTAAEARALAEKYFGNWTGTATRHEPPPVENKTARGVSIIDKPGAPQTFLLVGTSGVARSTADYVPLEVMNNVLGGLYSSRININLREERGYTYGAFSFFAYQRAAGLFAAGGGMRTDSTGLAVQEVFKEMERIRSSAPTDEELKLAKGSFSQSLAGRFESAEQTANTVGDLFVYGLPLDYYQQLPASIAAVTADDVKRMADKYIHPESAVVVGAGDRAKIEDQLKKLSIGAVEVRDYEGVPVIGQSSAGESHLR
jgi:zinc protease